jgi:hypothetical protein
MTALVLVADGAIDRLAELGLSIGLIERVVRQADAEAAFCTPFDPPIMKGLPRWARTNRLPVFPRAEIRLVEGLASPDSAGDRGIVVEVSRL